MKKLNLSIALTMAIVLGGCAVTKKSSDERQQQKTVEAQNTSIEAEKNQVVQSEGKDPKATSQAAALTKGWPQASATAAQEMISKYGPPDETTSDALIWKSNIAPFKEIRVHKTVYTHKFPLLHQNALEHVVDYKVPTDKVDNVLRFNEAIIIDKNKGQMSSFAESEAMNILALNLAHEVIEGNLTPENARVKFGKETLSYMNGNRNAYTSVLAFGGQFQTPDQGETITNKIRWIGDPDQRSPATRQAEEEKVEDKDK